jgi:macrolide-specific efflux system membrane fusion protein
MRGGVVFLCAQSFPFCFRFRGDDKERGSTFNVMGSMKRFLWIVLFLALAGGVGYFYVDGQDAREAQAKIQTAAVERRTIEDSITAQGTLEPKDYVDVGVQVSGQIQKLYVDIGDRVEKDQLLAELDPRSYESMVESNKAQIKALSAQIKQGRAQLDFDSAQLRRSRKLIKTKAVSAEDLETKEKALKIAEASLEALEAQKEQAEANLKSNLINLGYTKIYAPMDGIVSARYVSEGQTLNANQTTPTILQVANLSVMTIRAEIAEADVMRLKPGMTSNFSTLGDLDKKWTGTIRQILPTPQVVSDVVLYHALIDVENKDGALMNGMSTQNSFILEKAENVLVIPTRALGARIKEATEKTPAKYEIHVMEKGAPVAQEIPVGLITRQYAQVLSDLMEGQLVITSGAPEGSAKKGTPRMPGPRL